MSNVLVCQHCAASGPGEPRLRFVQWGEKETTLTCDFCQRMFTAESGNTDAITYLRDLLVHTRFAIRDAAATAEALGLLSDFEIALVEHLNRLRQQLNPSRPRLPLTLGKYWSVDEQTFRVYEAPYDTVDPDHIQGKWYYDPLIGSEEQRQEGGFFKPCGPYNSEGEAVVAARKDMALYVIPNDED